jgi:hypothetical protein
VKREGWREERGKGEEREGWREERGKEREVKRRGEKEGEGGGGLLTSISSSTSFAAPLLSII